LALNATTVAMDESKRKVGDRAESTFIVALVDGLAVVSKSVLTSLFHCLCRLHRAASRFSSVRKSTFTFSKDFS